jgi:hypothetical protein
MYRIAFTTAVNTVHDGLMPLTPPDHEKRRNFSNGLEDWNKYRFGDMAFESFERSRADGLVLKVSSPDPDATKRGLEKYKNRWAKALQAAFGEPVHLSFVPDPKCPPLSAGAQKDADPGEMASPERRTQGRGDSDGLVSLAQIVQSVLGGKLSRAAGHAQPEPTQEMNADAPNETAPAPLASPLSHENETRDKDAPQKEPHEGIADMSGPPGDDLPDGLSEDGYATRLLEKRNIFAPEKAMLRVTTDALRALTKAKNCTLVEAARRLRERMATEAARNNSPQWYDWMKNGGWKVPPESH